MRSGSVEVFPIQLFEADDGFFDFEYPKITRKGHGMRFKQEFAL